MGLGVVRMEASREPPSAALVAHVAGGTRPPSAVLREHLGVAFEVVQKDAAAFSSACERARELAAEKRGGRAPSLGVSWVFAGGPDTDDVHRDESTIPADAPATLAEGRPWTLADCRGYARTCKALLDEAMPGEQRVVCLHLDEKAVHVQAEMPALVGSRVGNQMVRESMARLASGFGEANAAARKKLGEREAEAEGRDKAERAAERKPKRRRRWVDKGAGHCYLDHHAQMRLIHDVYAERMADFGIERAKGGKRQHHERVDRSKAMDARAASVRRETERRTDLAQAEKERLEALAKLAKKRGERLIEEGNRERKRVDGLLDEAVSAEHRVEQAKQRHQQLEAAYNDKRRQLRRRLAQDLKRQRGLDAAERDRLTRERGEQEEALREVREQARLAREEVKRLQAELEDTKASEREEKERVSALLEHGQKVMDGVNEVKKVRKVEQARAELARQKADGAEERLRRSERVWSDPGGLRWVFEQGRALERNPGRRGEIDFALHRFTGHDLAEFEHGLGARGTARRGARSADDGPEI